MKMFLVPAIFVAPDCVPKYKFCVPVSLAFPESCPTNILLLPICLSFKLLPAPALPPINILFVPIVFFKPLLAPKKILLLAVLR